MACGWSIIKMLKSTNLKSFFVGEAIKHFAQTSEGKIFLNDVEKDRIIDASQGTTLLKEDARILEETKIKQDTTAKKLDVW